ncbi:uncharacterized protein LOC141601548 [Silene latifolia]|uniref:uncharacterized protein LOC141601548 n=1 Tax=Silene latifolia TaxID=37657 RepID=UPI003D77B2D5
MGANSNFELKGYFIHNLPKFLRHAGDYPNLHLSEFYMMCEGAIPNGVTEDQFKMRAFPFSLLDAAKDWLFYLPPGTIPTWKAMKSAFLKIFYPDSRHNHAKKAITSPEQEVGESLYEYWERPKNGECRDRGGGVDNYFVAEVNEIIEWFAASTRSYGRGSRGSKNLNSIETPSSSNQKLDKSIDDLTKLEAHLMKNNQCVGGAQGSNAECNFCQGPHPMESCPIMQEQGICPENVSAMGHGNYKSRNPTGDGYYKYDPSGNTYNVGSRDNPNLSWGGDTSKSF